MLSPDLFYAILKAFQGYSNAQKIGRYQLHHLPNSYMLLFMAIGMAPGIHATEIALRMGRSPQNLTRRLNELVKMGAIYKDANKALFLTEAAKRTYDEMMKEIIGPVQELSILLKEAQPPFYTPDKQQQDYSARPQPVNEYKEKWEEAPIYLRESDPTYATTSPFRQPSATEGGTLGV